MRAQVTWVAPIVAITLWTFNGNAQVPESGLSKEPSKEVVSRVDDIEACWESVTNSSRFAQLATKLWLTTNMDLPITSAQLQDRSTATLEDREAIRAWLEQTRPCSDWGPMANRRQGDSALAAHIATRQMILENLIRGASYGRTNEALYEGAKGLDYQIHGLPQYQSAGNRISEDESPFRTIARQVSNALASGNADKLERLASDLLSRPELTPSGVVAIHRFHQAMAVYLGEGAGTKGVSTGHPLESILSTVHVWQKKYPKSAAAFVSEGSLLLSHSLGARGETTIDQVPHDKLVVFESNLGLARAALMSSKAIGKADPIWYETMLTAGQYSGMDRQAFYDLVDEGMHAYPNDFDMAEMGLFYIFPIWGGSREEIARYVAHSLA